jgi:hypothetical protein
MDKLSLDQWWKAVAAAGVAISVAAVAAKYNALLLVGIGAIFIGIGEWINRPHRSYFAKDPFGGNGIVSGHVHEPRKLGVFLDVVGIALIGYGLFKIIIAT